MPTLVDQMLSFTAHIEQKRTERTFIIKKVMNIGSTWKEKWKNTMSLKKKDTKHLTIKMKST